MPGSATGAPRVIACCGEMFEVAGLERLTFEVLRVLRRHGATVHVIVNTWHSQKIVGLATEVGATWSTGYYWHAFGDRKSTRLNSSHIPLSRMPSSA